ncbi:MAG: hypothetical protein U0797_10910 [Gemmataceae bacterium]
MSPAEADRQVPHPARLQATKRCRRARRRRRHRRPALVAAVDGFGGKVVLTRRDHPSGTDRVAKVAGEVDGDILVNLEGDGRSSTPRGSTCSSACSKPTKGRDGHPRHAPALEEQYRNPNCVKVVVDDPRPGNVLQPGAGPVRPQEQAGLRGPAGAFLRHVGLYACRRNFLLRFAATRRRRWNRPRNWSRARALALGVPIRVGLIEQPTLGVDTYDDYQRFACAVYGLMRGERAA